MQYCVQIMPRLFGIDADGLPFPNSHMIEIAFRGETIETAQDWANTIIGPGVAKILVGELTIRRVALC